MLSRSSSSGGILHDSSSSRAAPVAILDPNFRRELAESPDIRPDPIDTSGRSWPSRESDYDLGSSPVLVQDELLSKRENLHVRGGERAIARSG